MSSFFSFLFSASPFFSITLAEGLILLGIVLWAGKLYRERKLESPGFFFPLLAFAVSSITTAFLSLNPEVSMRDTREVFLYLIPPVALMLKGEWLKNGVVYGGGLAAFLGILREFFVKQERLTGFVGHYMTEGGLMMMAFLLVFSLILFEKISLPYFLSLSFITIALALTLTRSSWVGAFLGACYLLYKKKKILLGIFIPLTIVAVLISPSKIRQRALSIFSRTNPTNVERINMWKIGLRMAMVKPIFGIGQNMASRVYPDFNRKGLPPREIPHLHNTYLQLLVERGIVGLGLFLLFVLWAFREIQKKGKSAETLGALAILIGFLTSGFFEYNFGDSEVKILFLILLTLPFMNKREVNHDKNSAEVKAL